MTHFIKKDIKGDVFYILFFLWLIPCHLLAQPASNGQLTVSDSLLQTLQPGYVIGNISIIGNTTTKAPIILRELTFKQGDTIPTEALFRMIERSRQNIMNIALFNFVRVDPLFEGDKANIFIYVTEQWYIWPYPFFDVAERNFNIWWQHKDLRRASYGIDLTHENFRGRKEKLILKLHFGYTKQYGLSYYIPYINKKQKAGLSFSVGHYLNHEVAYKSTKNILAFYNNRNRLMKKELGVKGSFFYRKGLYQHHSVELQYNKIAVDDTVTELSYNYLWGNKTKMELFTLTYYYKYDYRDYKPYPLKGYFFNVEVKKYGLGILNDEKTDLFAVMSAARIYKPIYKRFFWGAGLDGKISSTQNQPYILQRGLGYNDYVRGYEYYVVDGQNYWLLRSNIKYQILKPITQKLPFIKSEKFDTYFLAIYANVYADLGYVSDTDKIRSAVNPLNNSYLFGSGAGIDFITYYNSVLRLEYSINKMKEHGFFIHFTAAL